MPKIRLDYGKSNFQFEYNESQFQVLATPNLSHPLTDAEIGEKLDYPIDSKTIEDLINPNESVLLVVPDATRQVGADQIVNLLVRRLIANGTMPYNIRIIFATGIHRPVTEAEKLEILTPFIVQRIKTLDHNPRDLANIARLGETNRGIPIELNRTLTEADHIILIGGISFHYFAGFTGGRKLICPGLCSSRTISETHRLAFDFEKKSRREGVGLGKLQGNPVHEEFMKVVEAVNPTFCINTFTNDKGEIVDLICGDWRSSHQKACEIYADRNTVNIAEKRNLVIVSAGGFPHDINLIQAHKALETASPACTDGGTIILLAECADGLGRGDFLNWFKVESSQQLAEKLCQNYQVNGQTAWSLLTKAERFNIEIITNLSDDETDLMRLKKLRDLSAIGHDRKGYILPFGTKFLVNLEQFDD